ncbi:MAG: hypothetical protein ACYTAF_17030 [Planctomycetota bacterium]|jgi:hypothetical protein
MEAILQNLPGAINVGMGAVLALMGYRILRFESSWMAILLLGTIGACAGLVAGSPFLAAVLGIAGGVLGHYLGPFMFYVYVAIFAAMGGAVAGLLLAFWVNYSDPIILTIATAVSCAVLALLDARKTVVFASSAAGAAIITFASLLPARDIGPVPFRFHPTENIIVLGIIFLGSLVAGTLFQLRTNRTAPRTQPEFDEGRTAPSLPYE